MAVIGLGATTLEFLGMFPAADLIAPGTSTVVAATQPLLATDLGVAVLRERPAYSMGSDWLPGLPVWCC